MTLRIELTDEIYDAVRLEAEAFGDTAKTRIERMVKQLHRHRVSAPRATADKRLDDLIASGEVRPIGGYLPMG